MLLAPAVPWGAEAESSRDARIGLPGDGEWFHYRVTATSDSQVAYGQRLKLYEGPVGFVSRAGEPQPPHEPTGPAYRVLLIEGSRVNASDPGDPSSLARDPAAQRRETRFGLATHRATEVSLEAMPDIVAAMPSLLGVDGGEHRATLRIFDPPGFTNDAAAFWGLPLPWHDAVPTGGFEGTLSIPWFRASYEGGWARDIVEASAREVQADERPIELSLPRATFEPAGSRQDGSGILYGFRASGWAAELSYEVVRWYAAGIAEPVEEELVLSAGASGHPGPGIPQVLTVHARLAAHGEARRALPFGAAAAASAGPADLGPLGADGPAAGSGPALAYPLAEALASVHGDPGLPRLALLDQDGKPVLTNAWYEERAPDFPLHPRPRGLWTLRFVGEASRTAVGVESWRYLDAGPRLPPVNREVGEPVANAIRSLTAGDLPPEAPTIGAALAAWDLRRLREDARPNWFWYALERDPGGRVVASVWAGHADIAVQGDGFLEHDVSHAYSVVGIRGDGHVFGGAESLFRIGDGSALGGLVPAAPVGEPQQAARPAPNLTPPSVDPVLAAAVVGGVLLAALPLYSRLDRARILSHPARAALLRLVEARPGIHLDAAQRTLGLGAGTLQHHLAVLQGVGLVRLARGGKFVCLYPAATPSVAAERDAALKPPRARALHDLVRARPGIGLREAARELGMPVSSLQWHAARLTQVGLLERRGEGLHTPAA